MSDNRLPPSFEAYEKWLRGETEYIDQDGDPEPDSSEYSSVFADDGGLEDYADDEGVISNEDVIDAQSTADAAAQRRTSRSGPARAILSDDGAVRGASAKPRHGVKKRTGLRVTLIVLIAIVLIVAGGAAYVWFDLNGRFNHKDLTPMLGTERPSTFTPTTAPSVKYPGDPYAGSPVNILVMGTDSREGSNAAVSGDDPGGVRSDTTFIAHVSADRTRVDVVSIPRDMYITIPKCTDQNGNLIDAAGWSNMGFNAAFAYAYDAAFAYANDVDSSVATGAACTIRTVEEMSNVRIDAYVVVDFMGFVDVVDAIGGLDITLLCPIYSREAGGIDLPEGQIHINGHEAVNLARARIGDGLGGGSDLERINRQHRLFDAILDKVYAMNYLTNFPQLYSLVGAVVSSVTTDLGKNLGEIAGFGFSLRNFSTSNITFITVPVSDAGDHSHVILRKSDAEPIWESLRTDTYLPGHEPTETAPDANVDNPESEISEVPVDPGNPADPENPDAGEAPPPSAPVIQSPSDC